MKIRVTAKGIKVQRLEADGRKRREAVLCELSRDPRRRKLPSSLVDELSPREVRKLHAGLLQHDLDSLHERLQGASDIGEMARAIGWEHCAESSASAVRDALSKLEAALHEALKCLEEATPLRAKERRSDVEHSIESEGDGQCSTVAAAGPGSSASTHGTPCSWEPALDLGAGHALAYTQEEREPCGDGMTGTADCNPMIHQGGQEPCA
jgi:hypothetical protein